ncbi:hypothetical protein H310_01553 [Aphanomyces invadans]|uniref:EamA domain-containing protein n=1 Tax=Aphanomyces invadans TaxID=157072 RepID=A0A024UT12_9STRA|nr:hypothetical protein H310_01553 [Aphanomyces invadans]ETW09095.1 hypothetical protein H310_01553 [Aphanomyces invadans]|eukprot:XP_008862900.1 hypothetical protein H310_01553 [Aphanomyces invadans]
MESRESQVSVAVDLRRASALAHISYDDLVSGLQTKGGSSSVRGELVHDDRSGNDAHTTPAWPSNELRKPRRSLVLTPGDLPTQDPKRSRRFNSEPFDGFTVPVKVSTLSMMGDRTKESDLESQPLLLVPAMPLQLDLPSVVTPDQAVAFLITKPQDPSQLILAVPHAIEHSSVGGLIRRASRLPSDIKDVALEATVSSESNQIRLQLAIHKSVPWFGFAILLTALLFVSAQGAAMQALFGVPPMLKVIWRFVGATCAYLFLGMVSHFLLRDSSASPVVVSRRVVWESVVCTLSYAAFVGTFVWALDHTSVSHAYIFCNAHSLLLVVAKWVTGQPVVPLETVGAILGIAGGVITTADGSTADVDIVGSNSPTVGGDLVALAGAVAGVFYLTYAKSLRSQIGVLNFCSIVFTGTWVIITLSMLVLQPGEFELSAHPTRGFFGWVHHMEVEFVLVILVTLCGSMGFVAAMKYFPALVVSVTMLLEPVVATVICLALGMASVPGWLTFVGGFGVIIGTVLVIVSASESTETVNVTDAADQPLLLAYDAAAGRKGSVQ